MTKTKFKKLISFVCAFAIVMSCMAMLSGLTVSAASVDITFNNNGTITNQALEVGASLPTPPSDVQGNVFGGWYTDTTWTTKVETVPEAASVLYAKWSTVVIDFNNITTETLASAEYGLMSRTVEDGVLTTFLKSSTALSIPAYDAENTLPYLFEENKAYVVKIYYSADVANTILNLRFSTGYGTSGVRAPTPFGTCQKSTSAPNTTFVEGVRSLTVDLPDATFGTAKAAYIGLGTYDADATVSIDKITIAESSGVTVIMRNESDIKIENLMPGSQLPVPVSSIANNVFLGWYADSTWTEKMETVPTVPCDVTAKWSITEINFSNMQTEDLDRFVTATTYKIVDGAATVRLRANYFFTLPAVDSSRAVEYGFEDGKKYKVTLSYKSAAVDHSANARNLYYGFTDGQGNYSDKTYLFKLPENDMTYFATYSFMFTASIENSMNKLYLCNNMYNDGDISFDKIIIEEIQTDGVVITLNNNGIETTALYNPGEALPTPTSDIEENVFFGWYADTNWFVEVNEVPEFDMTLYARWSTIVIDFNLLTDVSSLEYGNMTRSNNNGLLEVRLRDFNGFSIPSYDANGAEPYLFEEGRLYDVTVFYKATVADTTLNFRYSTGYSEDWGIRGNTYGDFYNLTEDDVTTTFVEAYTAFIGTVADDVFGDYSIWSYVGIGSTITADDPSDAKVIIDKIIVTDYTGYISLNNNGYVEERNDLVPGDELPVPESDVEGNVFLGWYLDPYWMEEIETVPDYPATLYARWSKIVVDFNVLTDVSSLEYGNMERLALMGMMMGNLNNTNGFSIPEYDMGGAMPYYFIEGNSYKITVDYMASEAGAIEYRYSTGYNEEWGIRSNTAGTFENGAGDPTEDIVTATKVIKVNIDDERFGEDLTEIYIGLGYSASDSTVIIDRIIIEDLGVVNCTEHKYTNVLDTDCNNCGHVREKHVGKTLVKLNGVWHYVVNGELSNATTLVKYNGVYYYVKNGVKCTDNTLVKYNGKWYHVNGGKYVKDTTLVKYNGVYYYVKNGVKCNDNTLVKYGNKWYHVKDGKWVKDTTLVKYTDGNYYYVKNGIKNTTDNTLCKYGSTYYHVKGGKWVKDTTLVKYNSKWYYVKNGKFDKTFNGKVKYAGKYYTVKNGIKV